ncbi:MAG: methyltransferase family protein [Desulfovibrio sp.]
MTKSPQMSQFGVGPQIIRKPMLFAIGAAIATALFPSLLHAYLIPANISIGLGIVLGIVGGGMIFTGSKTMKAAHKADTLATYSIYALTRNPLYAAWILCIFPAIALITGAYLVILTSALAYSSFKKQIHVEDDYLAERFGQVYEEYRGKTNELVPWFPRH